MRRGLLGSVGRLAVSLLLLGILVRRYGGDPAFRKTLAGLDPAAFLGAAAVLGLGIVLSAWRWKILLNAVGVRLALLRAVRLYFIGYFFNFFLPTTVGGDVVRALRVGGETSLSVIGGSILVERFLGFGCLLAIGLGASLAQPGLAVARGGLLLAAGAFLAGVAVLLFVPLPEVERGGVVGRGLRGLRRTALEVRSYGFHPGALVAGGFLSLAWQLALVAANAILSAGLGGIASLGGLMTLIPVIQAVTMIPVSFGGLGVREAGYTYFFRASGLEPGGAFALGACFLGVTLCLALVGGGVFLISPGRKGRARE